MRLVRVYVPRDLVSFIECLTLLLVIIFDFIMKLIRFLVVGCRNLAQWRGILTLVCVGVLFLS